MTLSLPPSQIVLSPQRLQQLEAFEREYHGLEQLLAEAQQNQPFEEHRHKIVLYVSPHTRHIVETNDNTLAWLGYTAADLLTCTIDELEIAERRQTVISYAEGDIHIHLYECAYRHWDGHGLVARVRYWPITKQGQQLLCYTIEDLSLSAKLRHELGRREDVEFQFREKLKALNEISLELGQLTTLDDICLWSVELGIAQLGFDRLSLWFRDGHTRTMVGSFGVDEYGRIRDERGQRWGFGQTTIEQFAYGKRDPIITHDEAPLYNENSEVIGYGWHIAVPITNGVEFIGFIGADNFLHKRPLQNYQPELLRLYGATIGHLIVRQREQETIRKLSSAIQHSSSMVILLNKKAIIEFANEPFYQFSGYTAAEILGQHATTLWPTAALPALPQTIVTGQGWQGQVVHHKKDGQPYEALIAISAVKLENDIENFVMVLEDITLLNTAKRQEWALQLEQERAHMLEMFVTDVGHELRTPLAIIHNSNYLLGRVQEEAKRQKYVAAIATQVNTLTTMLDEMLEIVNLAGRSEIKWEQIRLDELLNNVLDLFKSAMQEKPLQCHIAANPPLMVRADKVKLGRALHEIVENAVHYTAVGGTITLIVQVQAGELSIAIQDTGIGIPADDVERIFEHFYRVDKARTQRHTGLGLAIAKLLVEAHHGRITVASVLGQGSCFTIWLPYHSLA